MPNPKQVEFLIKQKKDENSFDVSIWTQTETERFLIGRENKLTAREVIVALRQFFPDFKKQ